MEFEIFNATNKAVILTYHKKKSNKLYAYHAS